MSFTSRGFWKKPITGLQWLSNSFLGFTSRAPDDLKLVVNVCSFPAWWAELLWFVDAHVSASKSQRWQDVNVRARTTVIYRQKLQVPPSINLNARITVSLHNCCQERPRWKTLKNWASVWLWQYMRLHRCVSLSTHTHTQPQYKCMCNKLLITCVLLKLFSLCP